MDAAIVATGHRVTIGSPHLGAAQARWQGPAVTLTDTENAIAASIMIFNATPGESSFEQLAEIAGPLSGKNLMTLAVCFT